MTKNNKVHAKDFFPALISCIQSGKNASFRITGYSMWPLLCHRRDSVVLTSCDPKSLRKGDIVLFTLAPDRYVLHRITAVRKDQMQTTGDGNTYRDGWFPLNSALAKVILVERKGKTIRVDSLGWRILFRMWNYLYPIRKYMLVLCRIISQTGLTK